MSKKSVAYIKPQEPSFLTRLKQQAGYKEGPTVDTKRETLPQFDEDDCQEYDEYKPTVVVLKPGDLTADQAELIQKEQEEQSGPARLEERIVFRKPNKDNKNSNVSNGGNKFSDSSTSFSSETSKKRSSTETSSNKSIPKKIKSSKVKQKETKNNQLLSFDADDDDEDN